jgi:hypothetical protein
MSAFRGEADMTFCGNPLLRSLSDVNGHTFLQRKCLLLTQTGHAARAERAGVSAFDHRRTLRRILSLLLNGLQGSGQHTPAATD